MKIDVIYEKGILCEFVYSPLFEMLCALHVLTKPEHHLHRKKWVEKTCKNINEDIYKDIKKCGELTEEYLILMDFSSHFQECNDLNVLSTIEFLSEVSIHKINEIFKAYDKKITESQYYSFLSLLKRFYIEVFADELKYIEPIITRMLKRKAAIGAEVGIFNLVQTVHERIKVEEDKITFYKNKEYVVNRNELKCITLYLSTFIGPHLLLGRVESNLNLTFLVELETYEKASPKDLERTLKAIGDGTRLKILKEISKNGKSTQELSSILNISEAAVSKALKLLQQAELVTKERRGNYIIYSVNTTTIDYITYRIYEYVY